MTSRIILFGLCGTSLLLCDQFVVAQPKAARKPSALPEIRVYPDQYPVLHLSRVGEKTRVRLIWGAKSIEDDAIIEAELLQAIEFDPKAIVGILVIDTLPAQAFGECITRLRKLGVRRIAIEDTVLEIAGEISVH